MVRVTPAYHRLKYLPGILAWMIFILSGTFSASGQNEKFTATASASTVSVGDQFQVTFSVNTNAKGFRAPSFSDFNVLMGPSQSSQMQIINGSVSQTLSFTYILQAKEEGTFKIGSAEITVGQNRMLSNPLTIQVVKGAQKPQARGQQEQQDAQAAGGKDVFILASADKSNVYTGESIYVTYRLYTKITLLNYSPTKLPALNGFWSQEIDLPQQLEFHTENFDGVTYKVADIKKVVLFPQRSGTLNIDPMEAEVVARVRRQSQQRSNDPFDNFFNDPFFNNPFFNNNLQDVKLSLKSRQLKIHVKELPPGAPVSFKGAVGRYAFEASLDKNETKSHDAVTLKLKISGKGNVKLVDAPDVTFPPDFEAYDPKENSSVNATSNGVTGSKTFEYLFIPRSAGDYEIPVAPFAYFDLDRKEYKTIQVPPLKLKVQKGSETAATGITGVDRTDVQLIGKDIRFIKTKDPELVSAKKPMLGTTTFYTLVFTPALLFAGLLFVRRRNESVRQNVVFVRSQRANKVAMRRLSLAKKFLQSGEQEKFLDEMFKALWGFVSDKLNIPVSDLSRDSASRELAMRNVPEALINRFITTLDTCEFARFAGGKKSGDEEIYRQGIEVISELEQTIRS